MIEQIDLDHVALAAERMDDLWPRYAGDLAGAWAGGGVTNGFASAQVTYANGMRLEALEPYQPERNDFLRRFLDRNGPGPHHLTFKVGDIETALDQAAAAGFPPVSVDLSDPHWKEAFLHPKAALGVVIQLAQAAGDGDWGSGPPGDLPAPRTPTAASLDRVVHAVVDLDEGLRLFVDLLGGERVDEDTDTSGTWVDLAWPGPGRVRLLQPRPGDAWLGDRSGRMRHLEFTCADPGSIAGAVSRGDGTYEVAAEANLGTGLLLFPPV
jgi:catechol 2,3-dioxygenase-like lactoylglutathione lyase family enzyme